jgi:hypothetical protein
MLRPYKSTSIRLLRRFATLSHAAASTAGATNRRTIGAHREIYRAKMSTTLLAIGFTAISACSAISTDCIGIVVSRIDRTGRNVFIDDGFQKGARAHRAYFEEANLLASQTHLRDGIVDHHAELGMETNLKRIATHSRTDVTPIRRAAKRATSARDCPGKMKPQGIRLILR